MEKFGNCNLGSSPLCLYIWTMVNFSPCCLHQDSPAHLEEKGLLIGWGLSFKHSVKKPKEVISKEWGLLSLGSWEELLTNHIGPHQCYYMSLFFVNISYIGYINPNHFYQNSFICEIWCLFTFSSYSLNITKNTWKCVMLVKKNICVRILLHANIQARKAALVRNYFSRRNNFHLNSSQVPLSFSLSLAQWLLTK